MRISKLINNGFTLIELLVVISIIGILIGLSIFGLQGARQSSRDGKRKADIELIRSGIEIYKSDCNKYPGSDPAANPGTALNTSGTGTLVGNVPTVPACSANNTYINQIPVDPTSPNADYLYWSDGVTYQICAALEQNSAGSPVTCGTSNACGKATCNYQVISP